MNKKKKTIIIIAICAISCLLSFGFGIYYMVTRMYKPQPVANITVSTETVDAGAVSGPAPVTYAVGYDTQNLSTGDTIMLHNFGDSSDNPEDLYMEYSIYDGNKLIYQSELIEYNKDLPWVVSDYLEPGEYELTFHEQPYKLIDASKGVTRDNLKALYYIDNIVTVILNE